jgi:hypothetical protein
LPLLCPHFGCRLAFEEFEVVIVAIRLFPLLNPLTTMVNRIICSARIKWLWLLTK